MLINAFFTSNSNYTPPRLKRDSRRCCFYSVRENDGRAVSWFPLLLDGVSVCKLTEMSLGRSVSREGRHPISACRSILEWPRCVEIKSAPLRPVVVLAGKYSSQTGLGHLLSAWQLDKRGHILSWFQQWVSNVGHHSAPVPHAQKSHLSFSMTSIFIYASCTRSFSSFLFFSPLEIITRHVRRPVRGVVTLPLKFLIV